MSHIATIACMIKDLETLFETGRNLGLEVREGQKTCRFYGGNKRDGFAHAMGVPNNSEAYEIGIKDEGGHYSLAWDAFNNGGGLGVYVGSDMGELTQGYAAAVARKQAQKLRMLGYRCTESKNAAGEVVLKLEQEG